MIGDAPAYPFQLGVLSRRGPISFDSENTPQLAHVGGLTRVLPELANHCKVNWSVLARSEFESNSHGSSYQNISDTQPLFELTITPTQIRSSATSDWFCAHYLWQLLHDLPVPQLEQSQLASYLEDLTQENQKLVELALTSTSDAYFINDFHLAPAANLLRKASSTRPLSFFLHTPWPKNKLHDEPRITVLSFLARGMLAADFINFQTRADLEHFVTFISQNLSAQVEFGQTTICHLASHSTKLVVNPVSVDSKALLKHRHIPPNNLRNADVLIVHIARSDPAKNTLGTIAAFKELTKARNPNSKRMFLDLYVVPSRQDFLEYQDLFLEIRTQVAQFNAAFAGEYQDPIRLHIDNDYAKALGALRRFDVLVAPSWADGMNLIVKEAAVLNERNGVIVATPKVGAMAELGFACIIANSPNVVCLTQALELALKISQVERERMTMDLKTQVDLHNLDSWARKILHPIVALTQDQLTRFVSL